MKRRVPQSAAIAMIVGAFLVFALLGYFLIVNPQRSKAADLQKQIESTQEHIQQARALLVERRNAPKIRVADLYRLTKAMPDQADMAGIVLELNQVAGETGITFESITPQAAVVLSGYQAVPIALVFDGTFYDLSDFLFRLRTLVDVRRGALDATGRLFSVDTLTFEEGQPQFPRIRASLTVVAFVYGTSSPATTGPAQTSTTSTGTSPTPTGTTATTAPAETSSTPAPAPPPAGGASAAGAP